MPKQSTDLEVKLYDVLKLIAKGYQTPSQLKRNSEKEYGLEYVEALEYSYENIQRVAALTIKGLRMARPGTKP